MFKLTHLITLSALCWAVKAAGADHTTLPSEVVVTATKISRTNESIAQSVHAFDSEAIDKGRISDVQGIARQESSVVIVDTGTAPEAVLMIRGVSKMGVGEGMPSVGWFFDGAYMGADSFVNANLFDVERIEVIKGPQTTLYGKSAVAGVINIIPRPFSTKPEARASYSIGDGLRHRGNAVVSTPIGREGGGVRLATSIEEFAGYKKSTWGESIDSNHHKAARLSALGWVGDSWKIEPSASITERRQRAYPYRRIISPSDYKGQAFQRNDTNDAKIDMESALLKAEYAQDDKLTFTSLTTVNNNNEEYGADVDYSTAPTQFFALDVKRKDISQELRLAGKQEHFSWVGGVYAYRQRDERSNILKNGGKSGSPGSITAFEVDKTTWAVFGQTDLEIIPGLSIIPGLRYEIESREHTEKNRPDREKNYYLTSPRLGAAYSWASGKQLYTNWARGYKAGGINPGKYPSYRKEENESFELGAKTSWFGLFNLNGALFNTKIIDQQFMELDSTTFAEYVTNRGRVNINGAEAELATRRFGGWMLGIGATALDAKYGNFNSTKLCPSGAACTANFNKKRVQAVPNYKAVMFADYEKQIGQLWSHDVRFLSRADLMANGRHAWDDFNTATQESYRVINLSIGLESNGMRIRGFIDNIFDAGYFTNYVPSYRFPSGNGANLGVVGPGRHFGVEFLASF